MTKSLLALAVTAALLVAVVHVGDGQEKASQPKPGEVQQKKGDLKAPESRTEVMAVLAEQIDLKDLHEAGERKLGEVFRLFADKMSDKRLDLPILVDTEAFKEENPDAPDPLETLIRIPQFPRKMTLGNALRMVLSRVPTNNATYLIHRDYIEVTTMDRASIGWLLRERVTGHYAKKPLQDVLNDLSESTGATIMLDDRVGDKRDFRISAQFANDVSLGGALRVVTEVAGLKVIFVDSVLLVTTPEQAETLAKEKRRELQFALIKNQLQPPGLFPGGPAPLGTGPSFDGFCFPFGWWGLGVNQPQLNVRDLLLLLDRMPLPPYIPESPVHRAIKAIDALVIGA